MPSDWYKSKDFGQCEHHQKTQRKEEFNITLIKLDL
jgi:hypothetical protein